jgi:F0F1-type ATP synthase assembly protein I
MYSIHMMKTGDQSSENPSSNTKALVAADDARRHSQTLTRGVLVVGIVFVAGSTMLWPQGLFGLGSHPVGLSVFLIVSGALLLILGCFVIARSVRKLKRLQNNYSSVGKPDAGFVRAPDAGLPQIGQGHGGPLDASAAQFANPDKVFRARG